MSGQKLDDAAVVSGLRKVEWINVFSIECINVFSLDKSLTTPLNIYIHTYIHIEEINNAQERVLLNLCVYIHTYKCVYTHRK